MGMSTSCCGASRVWHTVVELTVTRVQLDEHETVCVVLLSRGHCILSGLLCCRQRYCGHRNGSFINFVSCLKYDRTARSLGETKYHCRGMY